MKTTIGGDRLGSGNKQEVNLKTYNRSTHDLSYLWRSSMSAGTLVPFMSEVALPGDTFDIDLACEVMTLPTIGPLFGSYKVQLDIFECPIRLYNGKLHMNMLGIGLDMDKIKFPLVEMEAYSSRNGIPDDNEQINSSSIWSYLNIRGLGTREVNKGIVKREFNAIPYLAYWDIYKNYYANKAEERGFVIHRSYEETENYDLITALMTEYGGSDFEMLGYANRISRDWKALGRDCRITIQLANGSGIPNINEVVFFDDTNVQSYYAYTVFELIEYDEINNQIILENFTGSTGTAEAHIDDGQIASSRAPEDGKPELVDFPLENIDQMRIDILSATNVAGAFKINKETQSPYGLSLYKGEGTNEYSKLNSQEGLGIKTYQSDLFNNWIKTDWIDGSNGINEVTAVSVADGQFTIDSLNLAQKVYNMLNRIAISGGSYDDWLDAVYTHERAKSTENPIYQGSLIKELGFEEVISNARTEENNGNVNPLGTLAGRGRLTNKNKGGKITIKVNEPSYIIGIVSLTPRIDYSQGNKWDVNLKTLNDLHKPALDEIGYQDLITDQMAWFDTDIDPVTYELRPKKAGKQPAWINYMTNVNQTRGNFAVATKEMYMTLNRRYEQNNNGIVDLTTYIDPSKFNNIFAETRLDSQNFWVQISNNITARRKMSAKVIPNL